MPRDRSKAKRDTSNALVASAASMKVQPRLPRGAATAEWQREAWYFYDTCGELRFAGNWVANALSRCTLNVLKDGEEEKTGPAVEVLAELFNGPSGQSQMLSELAVHLTVPGEGWAVGEANAETDEDRWGIYSTEEITRRGKKWTLDRGDGDKRVLDAESDDVLVVRIWHSHPRKYIEADSPVRAVLPVLRELEQLTKHVAATIDSRLAGAGLLLMPSELTFASPEDSPETATGDPFLDALANAMVTPIGDRGSAAAVVPIVVKAPGEALRGAQYMTFSSPLDENAIALRGEAIRRLALGIDLPPEILLGTAGVNHWGAWQIEESALKIHVEPLLELICDAFRTQYLLPALEGMGHDTEGITIGYDTSQLRLRPNRASEALDLYDRLELSGDSLRRETGFGENEKPDEQELESILLKKLAVGVSTSDLTVAALTELGLPLIPLPSLTEKVPGAQDPTQQTEKQAEQRDVPPPVEVQRELPTEKAAALQMASELLMMRALERAHNRLGRRGGKQVKPCTPEKAAEALVGAWDAAPEVARRCGVDPHRYVDILDAYARASLETGQQQNEGINLLPSLLVGMVNKQLEAAHG